MPQLLAELRKGNPDIDITILIATGMHRATTKEELIAKYGKEIAEHENSSSMSAATTKTWSALVLCPLVVTAVSTK